MAKKRTIPKFTSDFIPLRTPQEKNHFTAKPKLNKPLATRNRKPSQILLNTTNRLQVKLEQPIKKDSKEELDNWD
jgi:hypothetical protein